MTFLCNMIQNLIQASKSTEQFEPYFEVLESITFSGNEYFDTEGYGNQNTTWEVECRATDTSNYGVVLGARTATNQNRIDLIYSTDGTSGWIGFGTNSNNTYNFKNLPANVRHNFKCDEGKVYIDGELKTTISHTNFGTPVTLKIGCEDTNGTLSMGFVGELYVLKLNGSDYVPVLDSQLRPCLYNRVTKTFLYAKKISDGTTTYDLGFKRWNKYNVDYIESSGTQYIDTGHKATLNTEIRATMALKTKANNMFLFGARNGGASNSAIGAQINPPNSIFAVDFNNSDYTTTRASILISNIQVNTFYDIVVSKNLRDVSYNGTSLGSNTTVCTDTFASANSITICTYNGSNLVYNKFSGYIKKFTILENGVLIRDYKPTVWHNSDTTAVACMYDEVYNKMYPNAGTGSFKAYIIGADDTVYEVGKSVSGTPSSSVSGASNCFDTSLYGTQNTTVKYFAIGYDSNSTSGQLFGSYDGSTDTSNNLTINSTGTGNTAPIRFDGKVITTPIRIALNTSVSIVNSKYGLWVNDTLHGSWGDVNDFTTLTTMLILKCNNSTNVRNNGCGYCMIIEKDVPVAEYIPVKNGNTIGLYDKLSKTINTGVGTINFNALD